MPRNRSYSRVTREALIVLGKLIRVSRAERGLTAHELADRAGISRTTLCNIVKGLPGPEIGIVFEVASMVGVRLFDYDEAARSDHRRRGLIWWRRRASPSLQSTSLVQSRAVLHRPFLRLSLEGPSLEWHHESSSLSAIWPT